MNALLPGLRRRRVSLAVLALPVLLLHGLIPTGYMPVPAAAGFIGLCPGAAPMPPGMPMPDHAHHAHPGGAAGADGRGHVPLCSFAASGTAAGTPTLPPLSMTVAAPAPAVALRPAWRHVPTILRAQSSRAPPLPAP